MIPGNPPPDAQPNPAPNTSSSSELELIKRQLEEKHRQEMQEALEQQKQIYEEKLKQEQQKNAKILQENAELQEKAEQEQREKARNEEKTQQDLRIKANKNIVDSQSQTISSIGPIVLLYSPNWETLLSNQIQDFFLLNDGHILFSKSWLKNRDEILSTPLLFRPIYNVILFPLLELIIQHFATNKCPSHPGALFFITGDQGIGKTSLMLILMSTLSNLSRRFLYRKGIKSGKPQDFVHSIDNGGNFTFSEFDLELNEQTIYIHIHDDCPPEDIEENHLYIIFTSPDQKRLPPPDPPQPPDPKPSSNHLCHIFRLPTFSLAEDAVVMVACTPTVPFSLLSPEDMELRTEEQQLLLSIEEEKETIARELPSKVEDVIIQSEPTLAKTMLRAFTDTDIDVSTRLNNFVKDFRNHLMARPEVNREAFISFLKALFQKRTSTSDPQKQEITTKTIHGLFNPGRVVDTDIDHFYIPLCQTLLNSRNQSTELQRISVVIDWFIDQLDVHPKRDQKQVSFIKQLLRVLILTGQKTKPLFRLAMSFTPQPPDLRPAIESLSGPIMNTALTDQRISKDSLTPQLTSLKEHFTEPDIHEAANRLNIRDEVEEISRYEGMDDKAKRTCLFNTLIDILDTPPPTYDSHKNTLKLLFVLPKEQIHKTDTNLRNELACLLTESNKESTPGGKLQFIVAELLKSLLLFHTNTVPPSSTQPNLRFDNKKMMQIACDLLTMVVNPKHETVKMRLQSVQNEIDVFRNRLSFILLMDTFYYIARDMNILVSPHSILKGLSERPEQPPSDLNLERMQVFYRNVRDAGLSGWVANATKTLLKLVKDNEDSTTSKPTLEESVVDTVKLHILNNLKKVVDAFFTDRKNGKNPTDNPKWLTIIRSMMNTLLFLIDAGVSRSEFKTHFKELEELLEIVYDAHKNHLRSVAEYKIPQAVLDDDEDAADYVNDLTVFSTHFGTTNGQTANKGGSEETSTSPTFDVESLKTLRLPRTFQLNKQSPHHLEQMSIALFARNLLWFLKMDDDLPFFNKCYVRQFFTEFLQKLNPGDVVHRSFVDFMNMTGLLSQRNFGLKREEFDDRLKNEKAALESRTYTLEMMRHSPILLTKMPRHVDTLTGGESSGTSEDTEEDEHQPFKSLRTTQVGAYLLLWASTELLSNSLCRLTSPESERKKTASLLNVARASIFGPSPRWLTSTDARTNRGLSFLWDGVLKSEEAEALTRVADSNHSRIMGFHTKEIFFENILDAAWDDITALVPVLPDYREGKEYPTNINAVYSLMVKKTADAIQNMINQISFIAVSPFVELFLQSEVVSAIAKLMTQEDYVRFRKAQEAKNIKNLPPFVEEPLVCISFLLNCPTPINFSTATTSFHQQLVHINPQKHFSSCSPVLMTTSEKVASMSMLTFPKLSNRSVHGTEFPKSLIETERGNTDFYAEDLQETKVNLAGIDSLIVSRGLNATSETIFMPIQATCSTTHSLVPKGIMLIQQLLFQAMCHLEPSEGIVAMYNYATTQKTFNFPSRTGILGFHMVSSFLQFEKNTLKHMPSILRHRDHPIVTSSTASLSTMTTHDIIENLLANLGQYRTFSTEFNPWKTKLPAVNNPTDPYLILPSRWKPLHDIIVKPSTDGSARETKPSQITEDEETTKDWFDRMVRRTMQELNRIGISPDDLGGPEHERIEAFSSFILCTAISCRRNELLRSTPTAPPSSDVGEFIGLVQSIIGPAESEIVKGILKSLNTRISIMTNSKRNECLTHLDNLCKQPCIATRLHIVQRIMSNHAMTRIRSPAQECLSVLQSEKDGGEFRVPTRNNLSAILHCGTVLLDNISPVSEVIATPTMEYDLPPLTSPVTLTQAVNQLSNPPPLDSRSTSESPSRSRTFRIPLHSFVLAKYGFSDSIPALCKLTQDKVQKEVMNVTPAPLSRWCPRRVLIDPSLLPQLIPPEDPMSLFTSFIHRLFDNPFIPVTTSPSTEIDDLSLDDELLLSPIRKIEGILRLVNLEKHDKFHDLVAQLSIIQTSQQASTIFSLLPTIRSSLKESELYTQSKSLLAAIESIETIRHQPTLVFVKSGNDFFTSTNTPRLDGVDTTTESHLFPIPFCTGYKEADLREEMKHIYTPLTRLLADHFPTGRPKLVHLEEIGNKGQRKTSSSKSETEDQAQAIVDLALSRMRKTPMTPLFMFVVDEALPDRESLPMSLLPSDGSVGCGMMRQRNLADVLWILFLTRISREVMTLPLNTSMGPTDFTKFVIPFLANALVEAKISTPIAPTLIPSILQTLVAHATIHRHDDANRISTVGLELLISAYPFVKNGTQILYLSRLLMICPSHQNGMSRLDTLVNHPSPEIGPVSLIRWFQLLNFITKQSTLEKEIRRNGFTPAKIRANLLRAFYLIIEREVGDDLILKLSNAIKPLLTSSQVPLFFRIEHQQALHKLRVVGVKRQGKQNVGTPRANVLKRTVEGIDVILNCIISIPPNTEDFLSTPPNTQNPLSHKRSKSQPLPTRPQQLEGQTDE
ncbi:hypothetical protein BLNAU_15657 [Blattamonas nauphoetae]|uniref:Uncharacterized protein n=1 Tax=Blattamonas nauphoetae TaxID=2049346 RepID=A0ABQ9XAA6_9EUKA|nr:hypothetical protein BLNAU_15657 [Blattamonas nauphoetae]